MNEWIHNDELVHDMYFHIPKQVKFLDDSITADSEMNSDSTILDLAMGGIAYRDYIICGECGAMIPLSTVSSIYVYSKWVDISEELKD